MTEHYSIANKEKLVQVKPKISANDPVLAQSWRDKNREKYNLKQRELMRKRRAYLKYDAEEEGT